jgi:hypothetical protein
MFLNPFVSHQFAPKILSPLGFVPQVIIGRPTINTGTIDINMMKKPIGSEMTNDDIVYLKTKLGMLNNIYNIIIKHLCLKRSFGNKGYPLLANIKAEIAASPYVANHSSELCLSGSARVTAASIPPPAVPNPVGMAANSVRDATTTASRLVGASVASVAAASAAELVRLNAIRPALPALELAAATAVDGAVQAAAIVAAATTASIVTAATLSALVYNPAVPPFPAPIVRKNAFGQCITPVFDDAKLSLLINSMDTEPFLSKACLYNIGGNYRVNTILKGGASEEVSQDENSEFINLKDILQEKLPTTENISILCIKVNGKVQCTNLNKKQQNQQTQPRQCDFCERWVNERNMFRSVINDLLNAGNMNNSLELMTESAHLLPSAILNQNQYHKFFSAIKEYKKAKKTGLI